MSTTAKRHTRTLLGTALLWSTSSALAACSGSLGSDSASESSAIDGNEANSRTGKRTAADDSDSGDFSEPGPEDSELGDDSELEPDGVGDDEANPSAEPDDSADDSADDEPAVGTDMDGCAAGTVRPIPRESLRLNDWQFENAMRALFPFPVTLAPALTSTVLASSSFSTYPGSNEILANHARDLVDLSEELAVQAVEQLEQLLPCDPERTGEDACAEEFIRDFSSKAFRRPATGSEVAHLLALYDDLRSGAEALDFDVALGAVVQAVLLSPNTLYLLERGEATGNPDVLVLSNHEIASRLSFLFWNAPPDAALLERAEAGQLQNPANLRAEVERLLEDDRATRALGRFVAEWFIVADKLFVDHAPETLALAWQGEVEQTVARVITERLPLSSLLRSEELVVNAALADHYGLSPNPSSGNDDWLQVTAPDERRGGLLTTAQFAAATSHNNETSIIHRGKAVREQLLCGQLGTPDPAFLATDLMLPENATVRDRMDARMDQSPCGACHALMDPIGIGMEDLDQNGLFRRAYASGEAVDDAGQLLASSLPSDFSGVVELAHRLADSEDFQLCAATQWLRFAAGRRSLGSNSTCLISQLHATSQADGGTLTALLSAVAGSDAFIYRQPDEMEDTP